MPSNRSLTILGFVGYLLIGTAAVLMPSVMPLLTQEYTATGLSLAAVGFVFPAMAIGGILGNLLSGVGSDVAGRTRSVWLAALALAGAWALAALAGPWLLFLVALIAVGTAQGGLSTGINALIADVNRDARSRALNSLHGIYGIGAALSPLIFGVLLARGLPWRLAMAGVALMWLLYGVGAWRFDRRRRGPQEEQARSRPDFGMLRAAPFLALFAVAFIYNGVAYSLLGWIALFMQETAGFTLFFSISMVSVFYIGLTTGRFLCAAFSERIGYARTLLILAAGITLTYPLVVAGGAVAHGRGRLPHRAESLRSLPHGHGHGRAPLPGADRHPLRHAQRGHDAGRDDPAAVDRLCGRARRLPDRAGGQLRHGLAAVGDCAVS
ncbi:MAG: MFS transporter [Caldilineaceae bacterium]